MNKVACSEAINGHDDITAIMNEMESLTTKSKESDTVMVSNGNEAQNHELVDAKSLFSFLKKETLKPGHQYPSQPTNERYYDCTHLNVGQAVVFNQMKFKGEQERKGSQKDADDLKRVLSDIGFEVNVYNDYTAEQIKKKLNSGLIST